MPKPRRPPKTCRECGQPAQDGEALTHRGYHFGCGMAKAERAAREMAARSGPAYEAWLASAGPLGRNRYSDGGSRVPASGGVS
jgi:hypothetical protein